MRKIGTVRNPLDRKSVGRNSVDSRNPVNGRNPIRNDTAAIKPAHGSLDVQIAMARDPVCELTAFQIDRIVDVHGVWGGKDCYSIEI